MRVESISKEPLELGGDAQLTASAGPNGELWRGRAASPMAAGRLARTRLRRGWRLLLGVGLGILVAVMLTCTVPLYDNLVANIQIQATINSAAPVERDVEVLGLTRRFSADSVSTANASVLPLGKRYLASFTQPDVTQYLTTDNLPLAKAAGKTLDYGQAQVTFEAFDYGQAGSHMKLLAGQFPATPQPGATAPAAALITQGMAQDLHLQVGDTLVAGSLDNPVLTRVSGIWEPIQPDDMFWNGRSFATIQTDNGAIYPVLLDRSAFVTALLPLQGLLITQHWVYYTLPARIHDENMSAVAANIGQMRTQTVVTLSASGFNDQYVLTTLDTTIHHLQQQLALLAQPLYIIVAQVVGLALLFVVIMAGLLIESQAAEIAALKSRGASGTQLLGSYLLQGLLVGVLAAAAGPWLARLLALGLVHGFVPRATLISAGVTDANLAALADPRAVVAPAVLAALLGVGAVIVAVIGAARRDVLSFRREQGRSTGQPFWRRYHLDLALAVLCLVAYVDLATFGGLGTRTELGQSSASPLLLVTPALLLFAGALLLLRVFPYAAAAGARLAARRRGPTSMLAFAEVARNPAGPSRLTLLLALAVGLGLFALTYNASLSTNAVSRAAYQAGADVRLVQNGPEPPGLDGRLQKQLAAMPGVEGISPAYRDTISVNATVDGSGLTAAVLGVDPATWAQVAGNTSWRSTYAGATLSTLMADLSANQWGSIAADRSGHTNAGDATHPVWAVISQSLADQAHLHLGDRFSIAFQHSFGTSTQARVGLIVDEFPTLYPHQTDGGFVVLNLNDCLGAIVGATNEPGTAGPNEYWLKTVDDPSKVTTLTTALRQQGPNIDLNQIVDRRALQQTIIGNPIQVGMRGLLLLGAVVAAALAVLGSLVQSAMAARQKTLRFAVLRTLGMGGSQLTRLLLGEQIVVYIFGLVGGTLLGLVLIAATLPYLQFGDTTIDPGMAGVPPYVLTLDLVNTAVFYALLLGACALALGVAARYARTLGLGKALRLGED